ncbi:sensor histidine kinase [Coraliomargarita sp. SDUM461003]|uniref:histidine kinase n=1 Tax=Thalassobacterium maritimum TaxID=3041265 RepID=A0ABU1AUF3_9BACT|nr:sensor histidine kinase [Coraliomargarita sp. SDUM461003]MDQ8206874.1 sensor histidine kinase [Coraliomargarita sp. SDUM461003]
MRISSQLRWFIFALVVSTSFSIALVGYLGHSITISDFQAETLKKRSLLEMDRLQLAFEELNHDIRFIANLPAVRKIADIKEYAAQKQTARKDLGDIFEQMLRAKPTYSQIRYISSDGQGMEYVRVDRRDGRVLQVLEKQLQAKANRDYFIEASQKRSGEIYYSKINLNRENGVVEYPSRPVFRVAMPIYDSDAVFAGIVIINLNFKLFIEQVLRGGLDRSRYEYYLTNEDGYFLLHSDPSYTFGFDLGVEMKAEHAFPELAGFREQDVDSLTFRTDSELGASKRLVHFAKFRVFDPPRQLAFGVVGSYDDIGRASMYTSSAVIVAMCVLTVLASLLAIAFSSRLTKPLERITAVARSLSLNESTTVILPTDRADEIGILANTFLEMKQSIERHQARLQQANQRLFEMNRDLEHFARVASHDLREPIQRIAGLASLYQSECADGTVEDAESILEQLHLECKKALGQLADFREFTDITCDSSLVREECLLEHLVAEVLDEFSTPLQARGVQVQIDSLPQMSIYVSLVRVLYRNLLDNAVKHAKNEGFKLHFTAEHDENGNTVLGVFNSGSSIDADEAAKVFDVFRQLENNTTGHGMGLAICKRIVNFHSGRIWVESPGNHFHIKFYLLDPVTECN